MIFTSFEFIFFFALVLGLRALCKSFAVEKIFLLVASYFFYGSWKPAYMLLLLAVSSFDYFIGTRLPGIASPARRRIFLAMSLVLNLGLLGIFKYTNFFLSNLQNIATWLGYSVHFARLDIVLPAGISFFTFQSMSYTIDVYRGKLTPCRRYTDFLLFVAFFPQLFAGPIVRAVDFLPQLARRVRASLREIEHGLAQFALGAVKKVVISDQISPHVDQIFANPGLYDAPTLLFSMFGYAAQIYCDFSGYSDMAIGLARMMGYRFGDNFRMPYAAATIAEFWQRWHISLSSWLRDYLYIPLGGNRGTAARTAANLMATMLLGGLWHGASWNFIIWGALHGSALILQRQITPHSTRLLVRLGRVPNFLWACVGRTATLTVVLVGWVFFRAQGLGNATHFLTRIARWDTSGIRTLSPQILTACAVLTLIHLTIQRDRDWVAEIPERSIAYRILAYAFLLFCIVAFGASDSSAFIYFQF